MRTWARALRLSLAPTVFWDVIAGTWLAGFALQPQSFLLAFSVFCIWASGMALNDFADKEIDILAQRNRPVAQGEIARPQIFAVGLFLMVLGLGIIAVLPPTLQKPSLCLAGMVILYNLGGPAIRKSLGPLLLALCRCLAVVLGGLLFTQPPHLLQTPGPWPYLAYSFFLLFLSRLATHEETGGSGMKLLPFLLGAGFAPLLLLQKAADPFPTALGWVCFFLFLLKPAWPIRHQAWSPATTQGMVRRGLSALPLLLALALLSEGAPLWQVSMGVFVFFSVRMLVSVFPPE
jgi:4-hydroxybenzoate polyprenyltransferase